MFMVMMKMMMKVVVTMRRLNRYEVMKIRWLSGIEHIVSEIILYPIRSETLSQ